MFAMCQSTKSMLGECSNVTLEHISDMFHHTEQNLHSKGLITLWVVSLVFYIFPRVFYFSSSF